MPIMIKKVDELTVEDLQAHPVWRFTDSEDDDETVVQPVKRLPVADLDGKVVGIRVTLANGRRLWGLIGNVDVANARSTEHFLTLSVERDGTWFFLSRYHDIDYAENGPDSLARFLDLPVEAVFPIVYDLRPYARGDEAALSGRIAKEPRERLSRADLITMAVS